jgi:hypothetical protein
MYIGWPRVAPIWETWADGRGSTPGTATDEGVRFCCSGGLLVEEARLHESSGRLG